MEVLINELSLHKQFDSLQMFANDSLPEFIRIYSFLINVGKIPSKNYGFYSQKITPSESFHDFLNNKEMSRLSDDIRRYKVIMERFVNEPFWEAQQLHDSNTIYLFKEQIVTGTALAESYERNSLLISFFPSKFEDEGLNIEKENHITKEVCNFFSKNKILNYLYENEEINFHSFCKSRFDKNKLNFDKVNIRKSFDLITDKNDAKQYKLAFELFTNLNWEDILKHEGLDYKVYHDQNYFKNSRNGNLIYKFRASLKYRVFGYRDGGIFYVLEFDLTHQLSD